MEMCPYCGEEVPADSAKCWKCGTELSEGAANAPGDGGELEVPEDEGGELEGALPPGELIPCPHCESPVPKKASRCRECGRAVREVAANHAAAAWRVGTWVVVLGVGIVSAFVVVVLSVKHHRAAQVRAPLLPVKWDDLDKRLQPLAAGNGDRKRELWTRDLEGKWVKWKGFVVTKDEDTLHVTIAHAKGAKADCDVEFLSEARDDLRDLKPDQEIVYSARLVDFGKDGLSFLLGEGLVEK